MPFFSWNRLRCRDTVSFLRIHIFLYCKGLSDKFLTPFPHHSMQISRPLLVCVHEYLTVEKKELTLFIACYWVKHQEIVLPELSVFIHSVVKHCQFSIPITKLSNPPQPLRTHAFHKPSALCQDTVYGAIPASSPQRTSNAWVEFGAWRFSVHGII